MRNKFLYIAAMAALLLAGPASAADTIHAVIIGDTLDDSIGDGIKANVAKMKNFMAKVDAALPDNEAKVNVITVIDGQFSCNEIKAKVEGLTVGANDAVLFYYAGHGFRRDGAKSKFPEFDCRRALGDRPLELAQVVEKLKQKSPRLIISIADTCNVFVPPTAGPPGPTPPALPDNIKKAIKHLFLEYKGFATLSGSVPGEFSWYQTAGEDIGGFFTNQLLAAFNAEVARAATRPRWEAIIVRSVETLEIPTNPTTLQHPQFEARLREP